MRKSITSQSNFRPRARLATIPKITKPKPELNPISKARPSSSKPAKPTGRSKSSKSRKKIEMGSSKSTAKIDGRPRCSLSEVVASCMKKWFEDTLKEAEEGDLNMQLLVGQLYYSGYGVPKNVEKGKMWIEKASRRRPSALKVGEKHPGYNVSDSDSDDGNDVGK